MGNIITGFILIGAKASRAVLGPGPSPGRWGSDVSNRLNPSSQLSRL